MNRLTWIDEFGGNLAEYERMTGDKYEFMAKQGRPTRRTLLNAALNPMGDFYYKTGGETHESQIQISEFLVDCLLDRCDALIHVQRIVVDVKKPGFPDYQDIYVSGVPIKRLDPYSPAPQRNK